MGGTQPQLRVTVSLQGAECPRGLQSSGSHPPPPPGAVPPAHCARAGAGATGPLAALTFPPSPTCGEPSKQPLVSLLFRLRAFGVNSSS